MHITHRTRGLLLALGLTAGMASSASAFTMTLLSSQFSMAPSFNTLSSFQFEIDVAAPLASGVYDNPALNAVTYSVLGNLGSTTPSKFSAFNLQRGMTGAEFYAQGSSLQFAIAAGANLADGLQLSELVSLTGPVFVFNGREVDTGRYHPPLLELFDDGNGNSNGTGRIQNSNNMGGINPSTLEVVNVNFGDEYIVGLTAINPAMTLAVPEPSSALMLLAGLLGVGVWCQRRKTGAQTSTNTRA